MARKTRGSPSNSVSQELHDSTSKIQKIQTLSDGVILSSPEEASQAAASLLPSDPGFSSISQTPLVDSGHSPSSTRRYYENTARRMDSDSNSKQNDIWQKRERFVTSGHSVNVDVKGTDGEIFVFSTNGSNGDSSDNQRDAYSEGVEKALDSLDKDPTTDSSHIENGSHKCIDGNKNVCPDRYCKLLLNGIFLNG